MEGQEAEEQKLTTEPRKTWKKAHFGGFRDSTIDHTHQGRVKVFRDQLG
jgi:hypothetical protein